MKTKELLGVFSNKPCEEAVLWLETQPDLQTAWQNCERGDWMWWALMRKADYEIPQAVSVAFANDCVKRAKNYYAAAASSAAAAAAVYAAAAAAAVYAADAAAGAAADYAAAAADYAAAAKMKERKAQAEWIRENITCPF